MPLYEKLRTMRIALVEDDPWIRESLAFFLQNEGCIPRLFESGYETLKALKNEHFDLIISDSWLPDMDGQTFLSFAKDLRPEVVTVLIDGDHRFESERTADRHPRIQKPLTVRNFEETLEALIGTSSEAK